MKTFLPKFCYVFLTINLFTFTQISSAAASGWQQNVRLSKKAIRSSHLFSDDDNFNRINSSMTKSKQTNKKLLAQTSDDCRAVSATGGLRVRQNPSINAPVIDILANGRIVTIENLGQDGWVPISYPVSGYVSADYLTACRAVPTPTTPSDPDNTCRQVSAEGGLYVRREPDVDSPTVELLPNSTPVEIESLGANGWVPITSPYNGFVSAKYLTSCSEGQLQTDNLNYQRYYNDRFNYSVLYPANLLNPQDVPQNNDGRTFVSPDNNLVMKVFARHNIENKGLRTLYREELNQPNRQITDKWIKDESFLITGVDNNRAFYQTVRLSDNRILSLEFEYDKSLTTEFNSIATDIARSLRSYDRAGNNRYVQIGKSVLNSQPIYVDLQSVQQTDTSAYEYKIVTGLNPHTAVTTARVNCDRLGLIRFLETRYYRNGNLYKTNSTPQEIEVSLTEVEKPYSYYDANRIVCQQQMANNLSQSDF